MAELRRPRPMRQTSSRRYLTRSARAQDQDRDVKLDSKVDNNNIDTSDETSSASSNYPALSFRLGSPDGSPDGSARDTGLTSASDSSAPTGLTHSLQNLMASPLAGIYASVEGRDILDTDSPWDTGPERPVTRDPSMTDSLYMLLRDRCYPPARRRVYSISHQAAAGPPISRGAVARFFTRRGALLFSLGIGFAVLITFFHKDQRRWSITTGYLTFWGTVGMIVGGLQPLFDNLCKTTFPSRREKRDDESKRVEEPILTQEMRSSTHWDVAMRVVGTVLGIVYAFRHLIWTSSIQFSVALAVINPIFWWAVDRSKSGFILSALAAMIGSLVLLGSDLKVVPDPPIIPAVPRNTTTSTVNPGAANFYLTLGGITSMETAEETIWRLSVLFCSSICFGSVGRVLAADHSAKVVPWDPMVKIRDL